MCPQELGDRDPVNWELAGRLRALADPTRLQLLAALRAAPQQRACVTELTDTTGLPQPAVSRHLQVLHRAALLTRTRTGSRSYYQADLAALQAVADDLRSEQTLHSTGVPAAAASHRHACAAQDACRRLT